MIDIHVQSALNKVLCIKTECRKEDEHFVVIMHACVSRVYDKGLQQRNL